MESDSQSMLNKNGQMLIKVANEFGIPVIVTEQYKKGLGETIADIKNELSNAKVFEKIFFDATKDGEIKKAVTDSHKKTVIIIGMEAHTGIFRRNNCIYVAWTGRYTGIQKVIAVV